MKQPPREQRRHTRFPFDTSVRLSSPRSKWEGALLDVSLKGILMTRPKTWQGKSAERYQVEFSLDQDVTITMQVSVAHSDAERIGFRCEHIDLDSMSHLKRLVELNLGDEQLLNRELSALGGG
ncbi:MAG: PilZ domain-containing protein [Pseudomonadota bacterium]